MSTRDKSSVLSVNLYLLHFYYVKNCLKGNKRIYYRSHKSKYNPILSVFNDD